MRISTRRITRWGAALAGSFLLASFGVLAADEGVGPSKQQREGTMKPPTPGAEKGAKVEGDIKDMTAQLGDLHQLHAIGLDYARLGQDRGSRSVSDFALMIAREHQQADQDLLELSREKGIDLPSPTQASIFNKYRPRFEALKVLPKGENFNERYLSAVSDLQEDAIKDVRAWRANAVDKDYVALLDKAEKQLKSHQKHLQALQAGKRPAARTPPPTR